MIMHTLRVIVVLMACATPAFGQAPPPNQTRDDLQPGVNTSALPPQSTAQPPVQPMMPRPLARARRTAAI